MGHTLLAPTVPGRLVLVVSSLALVFSATTAAQLFGLSEEEEIALGREAAAEIEKTLTLLEDEAANDYVSDLGQTLARLSERPGLTYRFRVVDAAEINAFALPGGFIYVNRGLIEAADNESELAGVLAHEIGHVVARHGAEQARRAQLAGLGLSVLDRLLGRGTGAQIGALAAQMVTAGTFMRFSRDAEREADRLGAGNVRQSGHDPRGMVSFFERLDATREDQPNAVERFFASHPEPTERAANIADMLDPASADTELRTDTAAFRALREHLITLPGPDTEPAVDSGTDTGTLAPPSDVARTALPVYASRERDRQIAALFAPVFHQALGPDPRFDFVTRFDFDGDWRGDNNWQNAADPRHPLAAHIYYAVTETETHFLVFYAVFHPRDYKGGNERGALLSEVLREGARIGGRYDPTGLSQDAVLAHENDLEGCLVVAEKRGDDPRRARVAFVETLAHNLFLRYTTGARSAVGAERVALQGQRPELYIEPKGHGIGAYRGGAEQRASAERGFVTYAFAGRAEEPRAGAGRVDYDLTSIYDTLWARALAADTETYGATTRYDLRSWASFSSNAAPPSDPEIGPIGSAFRGAIGGRNLARPPWGWFDRTERDRPAGEWFFDPAGTVKRHFRLGDTFSTTYVHQPFVGIFLDANP